MERDSVPRFAWNGVIADFGSETLRDASGNPVPLRPRSFAVLRHLAENPGRLVTKDELMQAVWPGVAVTDDSLVQCIVEIRRAICDEAHAILKTVPRRGYRLLPAAEARTAVSRFPRVSRRPIAVGAALLVAVVVLVGWLALRPERAVTSIEGPPLLAVVPFVDLVGDDASGRLADFGKHFNTRDLARFRDFQMVLRGPTFVYRDRLAGGLAVDYVLGGSVARQGERLRLEAVLTDARTGRTLWSERWDRPAREAAAMQAEVAEQVANRLGGATGVIQEIGRAVARKKRPGNRTAWERLVMASEQLMLGTQAGAAEAAMLLEQAVALDPGLGHASARLALARLDLAEFGVDPEGNLRRAFEAAERATLLDPGDPWAHAALGSAFGFDGRFPSARSELETALAITPSAAEILTIYAGLAAAVGEPERGAAMADRVERVDPDVTPWTARQLARAYFMSGRYRSALAMIERLPEAAFTPLLRAIYGAALAAVGRSEEAAAARGAAVEQVPGASIETLIGARRWGDDERRRLIETLRLAGFPACAAPDAPAGNDPASRLPECQAPRAAQALRP